MKNGAAPTAAAEKAYKRVKEILGYQGYLIAYMRISRLP